MLVAVWGKAVDDHPFLGAVLQQSSVYTGTVTGQAPFHVQRSHNYQKGSHQVHRIF